MTAAAAVAPAAAGAVFAIEDELTIYRAAELCTGLQAAFTGLAGLPEGAGLAIDLAGVTDMDSAGVQLLMAAQKTARALGRPLHIVAPSAPVRDVFQILALDDQFAAKASVAAA